MNIYALKLLIVKNIEMKNTILKKPKWYYVQYQVNWKMMADNFSCITKWDPIYEINTELNDRYYWEDRDIVTITPIETPKEYCFY